MDKITRHQADHSQPDTYLIVFDWSSSMQGRRFNSCTQAIRDAIVPTPPEIDSLIPDDARLGLRQFGGYNPHFISPCDSTQLLVRPGFANRAKILEELSHAEFGNATPLTKAIRQIPSDFGNAKGHLHVILITDGEGNCDPEDACKALKDVQGLTGATIDIIGLDGGNSELRNCFDKIPDCHYLPATTETIGKIFQDAVKNRVHGEVLPYHLNHLHKHPKHHSQNHCNCHKNSKKKYYNSAKLYKPKGLDVSARRSK